MKKKFTWKKDKSGGRGRYQLRLTSPTAESLHGIIQEFVVQKREFKDVEALMKHMMDQFWKGRSR